MHKVPLIYHGSAASAYDGRGWSENHITKFPNHLLKFSDHLILINQIKGR